MSQNTTIAFFTSDQIASSMEISSKTNDLSTPEVDSFENYFAKAINQTVNQTQTTDAPPEQVSDTQVQAYSNNPVNSTNPKETNTIDNKNVTNDAAKDTAKDDSTVIVEAPTDSITIDDQGNAQLDVKALPQEVKDQLGITDDQSVEIKIVFLSKEQLAALTHGEESFDNIKNYGDVKQKDFPAQRLFFARYQKNDAEKSENAESSKKIVKAKSNPDVSGELTKAINNSTENNSNKTENNKTNNVDLKNDQTGKLTKSALVDLKESLVNNQKSETQKSEINIINPKSEESKPKVSDIKDSVKNSALVNHSELKETAPTPKESVQKEATPEKTTTNNSSSKEAASKNIELKDALINQSKPKDSVKPVKMDSLQKDSDSKDINSKDLDFIDLETKDTPEPDEENSSSKQIASPVSKSAIQDSKLAASAPLEHDPKETTNINDNLIKLPKESKTNTVQKVMDAEELVKASNTETTAAVPNEAAIENSAVEQVTTENKVTSEKPESAKVIYMVRNQDQSDDDAKQNKVVLIAQTHDEKDAKIKSESSDSSNNNQQKGERNSDQDSARLIESSRISSMIKTKEERIAQTDSKDSFKKTYASQTNKTESSVDKKSDVILQQSLRNNQNTSILEASNQAKPVIQAQSNNQPDQPQIQSQQTAQTNFQSQPIIANAASTQQTPQATMMQQYMEKIAEVQDAAAKQIVKGVQGSIGSERSHVTVRLVPESLGQIHIRITMENGQLSAQLNAEKDSTRAMMQQGLNNLRSAFDEQGLKVDRLVVNKEQFDPKQDYGKNEDSQDRSAKNRSDYGNRQNQNENNRNGAQSKNKFALWSDRMKTSDYFV